MAIGKDTKPDLRNELKMKNGGKKRITSRGRIEGLKSCFLFFPRAQLSITRNTNERNEG
jgi:hypothetical protein